MLADLASLSVEALHQGFAPSAGNYGASVGSMPRLWQSSSPSCMCSLTAETCAGLSTTHSSSHIELGFLSLSPDKREGHLRVRPDFPPKCHDRSRVPGLRAPASLPSTVLVERTEETLDTVPNRYVRFALEQCDRSQLNRSLTLNTARGARRRGPGHSRSTVEELDSLLGHPLFREVSPPLAGPRRQSGPATTARLPRKLPAAAALIDGSLGLQLDVDDPFLVSRKSISTLYEYWVFVRLAGAVARAFGQPRTPDELWKPSATGMSLVLKAGATTRMQLSTKVGGDEVRGDLFFNREFRDGSWTRPMRPDASVYSASQDKRNCGCTLTPNTGWTGSSHSTRASSMTRSQRNATERVSGLTC